MSIILLLRFRMLYVPGWNLSMDETLLRAYGRLGFKVRVVTKAARYRIKIYVCTDSYDTHILCTTMYTGVDVQDTGANKDLKNHKCCTGSCCTFLWYLQIQKD